MAAGTNNMHNLTTLIKRLEAATARLEDIASSTIELPQVVPALQQTLASPLSGASSVGSPAPTPTPTLTPAPPPVPKAPEEPLPESIEEYDAFMSQSVEKYIKISKAIGGLVAEQATKVLEGFKEQRKFLLISTKAKKPDLTGSEMSVYQDVLKPINQLLMDITSIRDSNRGAAVFSQLNTVAEGLMALAWVTVESKPNKFVEESLGSAQFFGNRVLKEFKDKDQQQVEWVQSFYQIFRDLADYVKNYFPNGLPWNPKGRPVQEVLKSLSAAPAPAAGGPPPPPPPPPGPPPVFKINEQKPSELPAAGGLGAVFSELNKGEAVTKGLRKVEKSEMTHKNPSLRAGSTVPEREGSVRGKSPAPGKKPKPETLRAKKPPKKELEGNQWTIENFEKESEPIEIEANISHSIRISKCNNTTVIIRGKANAVTIDNTNRLSLVVDSLVSTVDLVKSQNFALQVLGVIPTVLMDTVDGAQIYFSKESIGTRIFTSKSSSVNLNVIGSDDDYQEIPLPSQICSYYDEDKGDLVNEIVSHSG
ncbi:putative adenylyl cyclase-associated protein [Lasiosphaeria miniovina]|uniref:Adenylyl cyclase-associated protein n=1 Tax=Lasiosphaeria miniovina TaxID=1954250 RepID=A0AA40AUA3_9PEZI|nr:putative adenylyl cyclase-associated protein [Lasiosphaeria miniovina]KAK0722140.1 putative adenylyl cyclase-associated protein [Lasiosphaeria miniovina]